MRAALAIFVLVLITGTTIPVHAVKTEIFGYLENRFFLIDNKDMAWDDFNEKFKIGDYNRLRLKLKANLSEKVTVNVAVDFYSFHGLLNSPLGTYGDPGSSDGQKDRVTIDLDRAYVDLYFKKFDVSIGKQRIAMGVSYIWAPLDVFNRVNVLEPKEEKPGTNALKLYIPLGASSSIMGVFSPENDFGASRSGVRIKTHLMGIDTALTLVRLGELKTSVYGLDLRGENFVGWWIEGGFFVSPGKTDKKLVLGFDYTLPVGTGIYWLNEFFYDSGGEAHYENYNYELLYSGERFTLGRKYFLSMLRYGFSDFLSASVSYIGNWQDNSYILNPNISYDLMQNVSLSAGLYIPMGNKQGEFASGNRNILFIWLKVNF